MTAPTTIRTPYENRLLLVKDAILMHSRLDDDAAGSLAVHVLQTLNSIPETIR